jgi:signal transduction histidine kinase
VNSIREEEKERIARDLHDQAGQILTALRMQLESIEDGLGALPAEGAIPALLDRAVVAAELVSKAIDSMHHLLASLRPVALDRLGLGPALRQECRSFQEWSGVACDVVAGEDDATFGSDVNTALYRIAQEALTNVARHARASRVGVSLEVAQDAVLLRIADDGCGIGRGGVETGLGLLGMRERAEGLGGELVVEPASEGGTLVAVRIPLAGARGAEP